MTKMEIEILSNGVSVTAIRNNRQLTILKTFDSWIGAVMVDLQDVISEALHCSLKDSCYMIELVDEDILTSDEYSVYKEEKNK